MIDDAAPGATIERRPATFTEQITISKDITLIGAGPDATILQAPSQLDNDSVFNQSAVVTIKNGATVTMQNLSVAGPPTA